MTAGDQLGGGGVVGAIASRDRCVPQTDGQHCLSDARRSDQQDVDGIFQEPQGAQLGDECAVHRRLGVEVVVAQLPGCGQAREAGQAFLTALLGGDDLDREQPLQKRGVAEFLLARTVELRGQRLGGGTQLQRGQGARAAAGRSRTHSPGHLRLRARGGVGELAVAGQIDHHLGPQTREQLRRFGAGVGSWWPVGFAFHTAARW